MTREKVVQTVYSGGHHVVILGAGASIASTMLAPEKGGKKLPHMGNFVEVVGLQDIVDSLPLHLRASNFETLYSQLHASDPNSEAIREIEERVRAYFAEMRLPDVPTIYDYLVLSLRPRDLIATFNWDPFLFQAFARNKKVAPMPHLAFLHGCVALGFDERGNRAGPVGYQSPVTGNPFVATKILYPVEQKNYNDDPYIRGEWTTLQAYLRQKNTVHVTIFGYGAPASDVEAVRLLQEAWGTFDERDMEQFEIIDIRDEEVVKKTWRRFIHSHHYYYATDFFGSVIAHNPRRTFESYQHHFLSLTPDEAFAATNPVPRDFSSLQEMWDWFGPLIEAEGDIDTR